MEEKQLKSVLESLLFASGEPLSLARLQKVLEGVPRARIRSALSAMAWDYSSSGRGVVLEEVSGGYRLRTRKSHAAYVKKLLQARPPRLSRALLETLAIVAYRQPITRPEIEQLRGIDSGGVLETLLTRRLVKIAGRKEAPGRPMIYATTDHFLEVFALNDLESLPDLEEFAEIHRASQEVYRADDDSSASPPAEPESTAAAPPPMGTEPTSSAEPSPPPSSPGPAPPSAPQAPEVADQMPVAPQPCEDQITATNPNDDEESDTGSI